MKSKFIALTLLLICFNTLAKTIPTDRINGVKDERNTIYALTNAEIYLDSETLVSNATLLVKDNKIINISNGIKVPENAVVHDMNGAYIYPGFILMDSDYGLKEAPKTEPFSFFGKEVWDNTLPGAVNTNEAIKSSFNAVSEFNHDSKKAEELRKSGFTTALISKHDGIMRGTSALVSLDDDSEQQSILNSQQSFHLSFNKGSSKQLFPISLMGASSLVRQTWLDAQWYAQQNGMYVDLDLQALNEAENLPTIFHTSNWQQTMLADKLAREFGKNIIINSSGDDYKHIDSIKKLGRSLIVPINYSKAPDVSNDLDAWDASYEEMKEWELSPYNFYYLHKNDIEFAITPASGNLKDFIKDLRKAVEKGLPKSSALAALTRVPAKILNNKNLGHLNKGAYANFVISQGDLFSKGGQLVESWINGQRYVLSDFVKLSSGKYQLVQEDNKIELELTISEGKTNLKSTDEENKDKFSFKSEGDFVTLEIKSEDKTEKLFGLIENNLAKNIPGQLPEWQLQRIDDLQDVKKEEVDELNIPQIPKPFSAYGMHQTQDYNSVLLTNATVWTNESDGVLTEADVFIKNGKISDVGQKLKVKADKVIDASGKHITAGIIDEHSHIALLSVNDIAVNSSMVRMEDSLDSDNINIYRNLAGGVTAAQLLHGSANPIGGQSALIKMRWGAVGEELLIEDADEYIKFALGENVKRSRSENSSRYPLTRMGVEQVYRDAFTNAKAYEKQWQDYNKLSKKAKAKTPPPRRDLMHESTLEVVNSERFISCHSYVQSEINMLMDVAEDFDFKVNTFTHILEGYKVADKMLEHGVGASTFSDWWAYKWEVNYAIPYNPTILTKVGVTTAVNSDDAEMSRRLNQEAAKSIKYGGLSEEEALKMVTLNPAKLLHLDDRMGSIKVGKDADIVLWNDNPTSIYAIAEKTFVDGRLLFDREQQTEIESSIEKERQRLIKAINESSEPKKPSAKPPAKQMHCDSITGYEYLTEEVL